MSAEHQRELQAAVLRNTSKDPVWIGYWLTRHRRHERLEETEIVSKLGVTRENYVLLCLCRTPRPDHFHEDLESIARRTGVNQLELARLLRQEENLEKLHETSPPSASGWLMAASDREAESSEPPPESEQPDD